MYYFLNTLSSLNVAYTFSFILPKKGKAKEERGGNIIVKKIKSKGTNVAHTHKKKGEVETKSEERFNCILIK